MVVFLHAAVPYLTHPMPGLLWPVRDSTSSFVDASFWAIEIVVMPLFLVLSGFYAFKAFRSCDADAKTFLNSRARRLIRPLLFAAVVILPIDLYLWVLGLIADGLVPMTKLRSLKIPSPHGDHLWGTSHLWFLLYVFLYGCVLVAVARCFRSGVALKYRPTIRRASAIALPAVGALVLTFAPEVVFGFQHAFMPVFSKWLYSGTFFAGGAMIAIFDPHFRTIDRLAYRSFLHGTLLVAAAVVLGTWSLDTGSIGIDAPDRALSRSTLASISLAFITALAAWTFSLGAIGVANRQAQRVASMPRLAKAVTYLGGASFWVYLVHHPIVGLVQIDLKWLMPGASPMLKALITTGIACGFAVVTYELLIRKTWFGGFIGLTFAPKKSIGEVDEPTIRRAA